MTSLFLAWREPNARRWFPIGRLQSHGGLFSFAYTAGAMNAKELSQFEPLPSFPRFDQAYVSDELFPLFSNRLMPKSRPDYRQYRDWLDLENGETDPVVILARSGGQKATDTLQVFPCPDVDDQNRYTLHFLLHGIRHMSPHSGERCLNLLPGESLLLMKDVQNPEDPKALALRTNEKVEQDLHILGFCPRYLCDDFRVLLDEGHLHVEVKKVNTPPAPIHFRVMCKATADWPTGFKPFDQEAYRPLVDVDLANNNLSARMSM